MSWPEWSAEGMIRRHITGAEHEGLSPGLARTIATQLFWWGPRVDVETFQTTSAHRFIETGAVDKQFVKEIGEVLQSDLDTVQARAVRLLGLYAMRHHERGAVPGWGNAW